jgi:hypothetical protein
LSLMNGLAQEVAIKIRGHQEQELQYQEHPEFEARQIVGWPADKKVEVKVFNDPEYITTFYLSRTYDAPIMKGDDDWPERKQRLEFILTSAQLHTLFNRYCAAQHTKNPYENPTSLGSRIACDMEVMEKGGWEYVRGADSSKLTYKRKGGYDHWRFSKIISAIE